MNESAADSPNANQGRPSRSGSRQLPPARKKGGWVGSLIFALFVIALAIGGYFGYRWWTDNQAKANADASSRPAQRAIPVVAVGARKGDLPIYRDGVGSAVALNTVTLHTRVDGQLVQVLFKEGDDVKKDQLLVKIDPRPFQVVVEQAQAQQTKDQSALENAQRDLARYKLAVDAVPQQQLDTAAAQVTQDEAAIKIDQAQIDSAKLQLTYTEITAPISGRIGLRMVDVGNQVHASDASGLAVITQIQPISVIFTLPEDTIASVNDAMKNHGPLTVTALDTALSKTIATGTLTALDNQIDVLSGTYKLKATFDNNDEVLFPNQMVNARLLLDTMRGVILIPSGAIQRNNAKSFVYIVKDDQTVEERTITEGPFEGNDTMVKSGVAEGELVVTDGLDRLQEGSKVTVQSPEEAAGSQPAGSQPAGSQPAGRERGRGGRGSATRGAGGSAGGGAGGGT